MEENCCRRNPLACQTMIVQLLICISSSVGFDLAIAAVPPSPRRQPLPPLLERYACFNRILEITCGGVGGGDSSATYGDEILVFETARYGRNDTIGAARCQVPFARTCDLDVQHPLSRACGGRRRCSLAVNTAFFGDPCGYDEFLKVTYRCVPVESVDSRCLEPPTSIDSALVPSAVDAGRRPSAANAEWRRRGPRLSTLETGGYGYVSSPNYPGKYYTDADCRWTLTVQPTQTVRLTLLDFELDVRRGGQCHDFLRIAYRRRLYRVQSTADRGGGDSTLLFPVRPPTSMSMSSGLRISNYLVTSSSTAATVTVGTATTASPSAEVDVFSECGSLGKQVIDVASDSVDVWFKTGQSGLTQRGFIMYFEAVGPGCPLLTDQFDNRRQTVLYFVDDGVLVAETACQPRYAFDDAPTTGATWLLRRRHIFCTGRTWNASLPRCIDVTAAPSSSLTSPPTDSSTRSYSALLTISEQPATLLGLVFGAVTVILLATVFVLLAIYCSRRHYVAMRHRKQWRVVISNVHDDNEAANSRNDDIIKYTAAAVLGSANFANVADDDEDRNCDDCYKDATYRSMVRRNTPLTFRAGSDNGRAFRQRPTSPRDADRWQETNLLGWYAASSIDGCDEDAAEEGHGCDIRQPMPTASTTTAPPHKLHQAQVAFGVAGGHVTSGAGADASGCQYCEMVAVAARAPSSGEELVADGSQRFRGTEVVVPTTPAVSGASKMCPDVVLTGLTTPAIPSNSSANACNRQRTLILPPPGECGAN